MQKQQQQQQQQTGVVRQHTYVDPSQAKSQITRW